MLLTRPSLKGRSFVIQFHEIIQEFGTCIPWLDPVRRLGFTTNGDCFRDQLLMAFGCDDESDIVPLQFVTSNRAREHVGGIMLFRQSPEQFADRTNIEASEVLRASGFPFLSCFQVRGELRNRGHGPDLAKRVFATLLKSHGKMQWVVTNPRMLQWYLAMGATLHSPLVNQDGCWLMSYDQTVRTDQSQTRPRLLR